MHAKTAEQKNSLIIVIRLTYLLHYLLLLASEADPAAVGLWLDLYNFTKSMTRDSADLRAGIPNSSIHSCPPLSPLSCVLTTPLLFCASDPSFDRVFLLNAPRCDLGSVSTSAMLGTCDTEGPIFYLFRPLRSSSTRALLSASALYAGAQNPVSFTAGKYPLLSRSASHFRHAYINYSAEVCYQPRLPSPPYPQSAQREPSQSTAAHSALAELYEPLWDRLCLGVAAILQRGRIRRYTHAYRPLMQQLYLIGKAKRPPPLDLLQMDGCNTVEPDAGEGALVGGQVGDRSCAPQGMSLLIQ